LLIFSTALCLRQASDVLRLTVPAALLTSVVLEPWNAPPSTLNSIIYFTIATPIGAYICGQMLENARSAAFLSKLELTAKVREDFLTGLPNRLHFEERFRAECDQFVRYGAAFSVGVFDIDHFKRINDTHGHKVGDEALTHVASVLGKACRTSDFLARWGGEEFSVLFRAADKEAAQLAVDRILMSLASAPLHVGPNILLRLTASAGIATASSANDLGELMTQADKALYRAKVDGRNRSIHVADFEVGTS
jgi:diguanylate cyclase (GGDEF)-like protein